jgi:hypothetical protein
MRLPTHDVRPRGSHSFSKVVAVGSEAMLLMLVVLLFPVVILLISTPIALIVRNHHHRSQGLTARLLAKPGVRAGGYPAGSSDPLVQPICLSALRGNSSPTFRMAHTIHAF